jgi:hypothetical protein
VDNADNDPGRARALEAFFDGATAITYLGIYNNNEGTPWHLVNCEALQSLQGVRLLDLAESKFKVRVITSDAPGTVFTS